MSYPDFQWKSKDTGCHTATRAHLPFWGQSASRWEWDMSESLWHMDSVMPDLGLPSFTITHFPTCKW